MDEESRSAKLNAELQSLSNAVRAFVGDRSYQHPIQSAILNAVFQRLLEVGGFFVHDRERIQAESGRIVVLLEELKELADWVNDPNLSPPLAAIEADIDVWVSDYVAAGFKGAGAYSDNLRKIWLGKRVGRPAELKHVAVRAVEMQIADPSLTWDALADELLSDEKKKSVASPGQCLRQEVILLRKVLKKFGLPGSEPFDRRAHKGVRVSHDPL